MKRTKILMSSLIIFILLPLGFREVKADPFPNVDWYYLDVLHLNNDIKWNYTRIIDNRYWTIIPINDRLDAYFLLNITIMSNTTIDVFLFGDGGALNELDIPEGTRIGINKFSFQYLLKPSEKEGTSSVYLYIDNSDDDGRGTLYNGDALVEVAVITEITEITVLPTIIIYLYIFIPIAILGIIGIIFYYLKKHRKKLVKDI